MTTIIQACIMWGKRRVPDIKQSALPFHYSAVSRHLLSTKFWLQSPGSAYVRVVDEVKLVSKVSLSFLVTISLMLHTIHLYSGG
jgi:hypothetical protein